METVNSRAVRNQAQPATPSRVAAGSSPIENRLKTASYAGYVLVAIVALGAPLVLSDIYELNVLVFAVINAIMATGLAIVVRTGRLSLAQATFGGVGGYLTGFSSRSMTGIIGSLCHAPRSALQCSGSFWEWRAFDCGASISPSRH